MAHSAGAPILSPALGEGMGNEGGLSPDGMNLHSSQ
jgi:hypothetical protein